MSDYKIFQGGVIRKSDGAYIPEGNDDWLLYLQWIAAGGIPDPADTIPTMDAAVKRSEAYRSESDPLFFKAQRGEATMADWLAKVEEIKARYPG